MLVHIKKIINDAVKRKYAVGAFNVNNLEILMSVLRAAEKQRSPVIIQATEGAIAYTGLGELIALASEGAAEVSVPVALHLDHGHSPKLIHEAIKSGFSSVMIDASDKSFEENVKLTKQVVSWAKSNDVWVQAELGRLSGSEDWLSVGKGADFLTEPVEAVEFIEATGINAFAPSVGNYHGVAKILEKKKLTLDLRRIAAIAKVAGVPLVLHGASGFPDKQIKAAIKAGIRVINIDSELRISFTEALRKFMRENKEVYDPRKILEPSMAAMQKVVERKMVVFGSKGRAGT